MNLVYCCNLTLLLDIRGHIAIVAAYSSGTLTGVLSQKNVMPQTQGMAPTPSQYTDTGRPFAMLSIYLCGTTHWSTHLPIIMFWVRPDRDILPDLQNTPANAQLCY